jgi:hypothetical protein
MAMKLPTLARITLVALLLAGCSLGPGGQATPTARPVVTPSATPSATPTPAAVPSIEPSVEPSREPGRTPDIPPPGYLQGDSDPVEGWLGSYCWLNSCVDMAGIPPKAGLPQITKGADPLEFSLSDGATFTGWTVSYGRDSDTGSGLTILDQGGASSDPDAQPQSAPPELNSVEFDSPPNGDWVLLMSVQFPGGDLSYAWHLIVE